MLPASDNDHFHQSRSRCLTDKRSASTVAQKHIWRHIYDSKNTFCNSTYWDDCNLLGPSKMKKKTVGCFIIKSLSLHLVFATSTTQQLVIPILHIKIARKHSCEFPQRSWGGQLKTHPDIHVRFVWEIRKESVEDRLAREKKKKKKKRG